MHTVRVEDINPLNDIDTRTPTTLWITARSTVTTTTPTEKDHSPPMYWTEIQRYVVFAPVGPLAAQRSRLVELHTQFGQAGDRAGPPHRFLGGFIGRCWTPTLKASFPKSLVSLEFGNAQTSADITLLSAPGS